LARHNLKWKLRDLSASLNAPLITVDQESINSISVTDGVPG
jgi:hypothetical protein